MKNNSAFPISILDSPETNGMTLLDFYAGQALTSLTQDLSRPSGIKEWIQWALGKNYIGKCGHYPDLARHAYGIADAMMKERESREVK